jgi:hypothetical protein
MSLLKKSWEKDTEKKKIPELVLDKIASRGSFVVVGRKKDGSQVDELNNKILKNFFNMWMENIGDNFVEVKLGKTIDKIENKRDTAIIVGRGPSLYEKKHIELLKNVKNITIISTEGALKSLLEAGIEPDYVMNIDGHRELILPHYNTPLLDSCKTKAIMSVVVSHNVVNRFPNDIYFYTPILDDINKDISITNAISSITNSPKLCTGSNVGIAGIYLSEYLGFKNIILIGVDLGYSPETKIEESTYYDIVKEVMPDITIEQYKDMFVIEGYNPDFNVNYYTNIAWYSDIEVIIEHSKKLSDNGIKLINCTEGGALHGGKIRGMKFKEALDIYDKI